MTARSTRDFIPLMTFGLTAATAAVAYWLLVGDGPAVIARTAQDMWPAIRMLLGPIAALFFAATVFLGCLGVQRCGSLRDNYRAGAALTWLVAIALTVALLATRGNKDWAMVIGAFGVSVCLVTAKGLQEPPT